MANGTIPPVSSQGGEFRINTTTAGDQTYPAVAMDSAGDFTVTWTSSGQDGSAGGIYAQRYNSSGVAQGGEVQVNTTTAGDQTTPDIAMDRPAIPSSPGPARARTAADTGPTPSGSTPPVRRSAASSRSTPTPPATRPSRAPRWTPAAILSSPG